MDKSFVGTGDSVTALTYDPGEGKVLFLPNGTAWSQRALLVGEQDMYGMNGDQIVDSTTDSGAVYLYCRNGDVWNKPANIKASNTESRDPFGTTLAVTA